MENYANDAGREFGWDDEIQNDSPDLVLLPEGEYVWGFDCTEKNRANRLSNTMIEFSHEYPLIDRQLTKQDHYDLRAIAKFCKEKGIEPLDMTLRELNQFIIKS